MSPVEPPSPKGGCVTAAFGEYWVSGELIAIVVLFPSVSWPMDGSSSPVVIAGEDGRTH